MTGLNNHFSDVMESVIEVDTIMRYCTLRRLTVIGVKYQEKVLLIGWLFDESKLAGGCSRSSTSSSRASTT